MGVFIAAFLSIFADTLWLLIALRFVFGFSMGVAVPVMAAYLAEILPKDIRAKYYLYVQQAFPIGECVTIVIAWTCLQSLESGNWRQLLLWSSVPAFVSVYVSYVKLVQSPRFMMLVL